MVISAGSPQKVRRKSAGSPQEVRSKSDFFIVKFRLLYLKIVLIEKRGMGLLFYLNWYRLDSNAQFLPSVYHRFYPFFIIKTD